MMPLAEMACAVLTTSDSREKRFCRAGWQRSGLNIVTQICPLRLAPPPRQICPPDPISPSCWPHATRHAAKPDQKSGRNALLHAVAHIELNAVDLHWDLIARFSATPMPIGYYDDWVKAADEESKHFNLMCDCLEAHGSFYGAMVAHAGMWRAAEDTAEDFLGRLAVVPMVLEARGLDVTPSMIRIFENAKDQQVVDALNVIYAEEVAHVAYGSKWFHFLCGRDNIDPKPKFHALVRQYFHGALKPPFNEAKRAEAGIAPDFYWPLADEMLPQPAIR